MPETCTTPLDTPASDTAGSERAGSRLLLQEVFHDSRTAELVAQFNDCVPGLDHAYLGECGGVLRCIWCGKGFA